jgi:phage regulator Rha-like protein
MAGQIDEQTFALLMARFDTLEQQTKDQTTMMIEQAKLNQQVRDIVQRHQQYFNLIKWFAAPSGILAVFVGWFWNHK